MQTSPEIPYDLFRIMLHGIDVFNDTAVAIGMPIASGDSIRLHGGSLFTISSETSSNNSALMFGIPSASGWIK